MMTEEFNMKCVRMIDIIHLGNCPVLIIDAELQAFFYEMNKLLESNVTTIKKQFLKEFPDL